VLRAFLKRGNARAERLVEESGGFLLLQSIPGRPNTGAIYAYVEHLEAFFLLWCEQKEDTFNGEDFQNALRVHHLVKFVSGRPGNAHRRHRRNRKVRPVVNGATTIAAPPLPAQGVLVASLF
jgi:hypothetical protein